MGNPPDIATTTTPLACGSCHAREYEEWSRSAHAHSTSSPVFSAMLPRIEEELGPGAREQCVGCHAPASSGEPVVGCVTCHAAIGNRETRDGALIVRPDGPLAGPNVPANAPHAVRTSGFLATSELCGTCHELSGPGHFVETTYSEYSGSIAAQNGVTCIRCHMPRAQDEHGRGRTRHDAFGVDPGWTLSEEENEIVAETTRTLLANSIRLVLDCEDENIRATVTNLGAAHAIPTGVAFLRDLRVVVAWTNREGELAEETRAIAIDVDGSRTIDFAAPRVETATARVVFRPFRTSVLAELGLHALDAELPVHELATGSCER